MLASVRCGAETAAGAETARNRGNGKSATYIFELARIRRTGYTNPTVKRAAQFFKVLADEARLKLLWVLFNQPELCVCDVMAVVGITQSKASRHLGTLRHAGLVADRKDGLWSYYSLCPVSAELAKEHMDLLRASLARRADADQLLHRLHEWLKERNRGVGCTKDAACAFAPKRAAAGKTAGRKRGSR